MCLFIKLTVPWNDLAFSQVSCQEYIFVLLDVQIVCFFLSDVFVFLYLFMHVSECREFGLLLLYLFSIEMP